MEQKRIRIISKTHELVGINFKSLDMARILTLSIGNDIVSIPEGQRTVYLPWPEFNKRFDIVDRYWAVLKEDEKALYNNVDRLLEQMMIAFMITRNYEADGMKRLAAMGAIGECSAKISKLLNCTVADVILLLQPRIKLLRSFMSNSTYRKPKKRLVEHVEKPVEVSQKPWENPNALGNIHPELQALKEKFMQENS